MAESLLGRVVANFESPHADFRPSKGSIPVKKGDVILTELSEFEIEATSSHARGLGPELDGILGMERKVEESYKCNLAGKTLRFIRLEQQGDFLTELMSNPGVKKQVLIWTHRSRFTGPPVCLIVGVLLCDAGSLKTFRTEAQSKAE